MNYYQVLGVSENATEKEIKKAYKALVKKYHPDVYQGDKDLAEKKIKELNEAYSVLSDAELKNEYDISLYENSNIELNYDIHSNEENIKSNYDIYNKIDYYEQARSRYTTNYYGISRDDLKHEKDNVYSKIKHSNNSNVQTTYKSHLILIILLGIISLMILIIILLSSVRKMIASYSESLKKSYSSSETANQQNNNRFLVEPDLSLEDVIYYLGPPDYTETIDDCLFIYYGTSYIVFDFNNKVIDWKNNGHFLSETYTGAEYKLLKQFYNSF